MASFQYQVTITIPGSSETPMGMSRIIRREYDGADGADSATRYAHAQHRLADGTRIAIYRRRLAAERIDPRDSAAGLRARSPRKVPTGPELVYRRYEVQGGIVRRTDR